MQEQQEKLSESKNDQSVYSQNKKRILILITLPLSLFILTLFINLSIKSSLENLVKSKLLHNPRCPLIYKNMDLSFFLPAIQLNELTIPGKCFRKPQQNIRFSEAKFSISFPSFWPIGIKTKLMAKYENTSINLYPRFTISGHSIQVSNTRLTSSFINQLTPQENMITGDFAVKGNIEIKKDQIDSAHLLIDSSNLIIPAQNISGIPIPALPLKKFELAANIVKNQLQVKAIRIGTSGSNLQGEFKGSISLAKSNISLSRIDLQGRIRISKEIQDALPLIRLLLNGKQKKDGFYLITLGGTLGAPQPKIVDPE